MITAFLLCASSIAAPVKTVDPTLLVIYSPACNHCHEWLEKVYPVYTTYGGKEDASVRPSIRLLNLDDKKDQEFISKNLSFVLYTPSFALWDGKKELYRFSGYSSPEKFFNQLNIGIEKIKVVADSKKKAVTITK